MLIATGMVGAGFVPGAAAADSGRLHGVIRDHADESAVAGATVQLVDGFGKVVAETKADDHGNYTVAAAPGSYEAVVIGGPSGQPYAARAQSVDVGADSNLDFSIARPVAFTGTVRDAAGHPLSGVTLGLSDPDNTWLSVGHTSTAADGTFTLNVPAGHYPLAVSTDAGRHDTWLYAAVSDLDLSVDRAQDMVLPVGTTDTLVTDQAGHPIGGADVSVASPTDCWVGCPAPFQLFGGAHTTFGWSSRGTTGADGHLSLPVLPDGHAVFTADAVAVVPGVGQVHRANVTVPGQLALTAVLRPTVPFTGTLTATDGTPLAGDVYLEDGEYEGGPVNIDESDGTFSLAAPAGHYRLHVDADVGTTSIPDGMENRDPVPGAIVTIPDFDLTGPRTENLRVPTASYTVHLLDNNGQPTTGSWAVGCSGGTNTNCDVESTDTNGTASVTLFPGGTGTGVLRHDGGVVGGAGPLLIFPGAPPSAIGPVGSTVDGAAVVASDATGATLRLPPFATLSGTVGDTRGPFDPQGASGDAYVTIDHAQGGPSISPLFNGRYSVSTRDGQHTISIVDDDGYDELDEPTATLPQYWQFTTELTVNGQTTVNFTVPDAHLADLSFVDAAGNAKRGGFTYRGFTLGADLPLGGGLTGRGWINDGVDSGADGHFQLLLFGTADLAGWFSPDDQVPVHVRISPGEHLVVADAAPLPPADPAAPSDLHAWAGPDTMNVAWQPPSDTGGGAIQRYILTATDGATTTYGTVAGTTGTIHGLTSDTAYTVTVTAGNARGFGPATTIQVTTTHADPSTTTDGPDGGTPNNPPGGVASHPAAPTTTSGYWALGSDGHVYNFGDAAALGNATAGAIDLEPTPTGKGYWILNRTGGVAAFGDAVKLGDVDVSKLAKGEEPPSLSATPTGKGYWIFTNRGRAIPFGDAPFLGDMSSVKLNGPVLGSVATPSGKGYYMVASDGGIFAFGDATFAGSMGGKKLNAPVQSLVPDGDGHGYWLVASDGGIFAFDAPFRGSMGGTKLNKPVVGMVRYGDSYLMVGADGGIFNFSSSPFAGSLGDKPPASPVVAIASLP